MNGIDFEKPGCRVCHGVPVGAESRLLADLAIRAPGPILHIAAGESESADVCAHLAFFAPDLDVIHLPGWDCLPFDRVSPGPEVTGRRIGALLKLAKPPNGPRVIVASIATALQRLPPVAALLNASLSLVVGEKLDRTRFDAFLRNGGFERAQTVREAGEYAVRGGIVDLWPAGCDAPVRIDLFGETIDSLRLFDPLDQRSTGMLDRLDLAPMSEAGLDPASITRFRNCYRRTFGAATGDDPLYEAVADGRRFAGMEHWLPLFHARLDTLLNMVAPALVILDANTNSARDARCAQITDYHAARTEMRNSPRSAGAPTYKPLPSDALYLTGIEWETALAERPALILSPFKASDTSEMDVGARIALDFAQTRKTSGCDPMEDLAKRVKAHAREGRRVLVAAYSPGSLSRIASLAVAPPATVENGPALFALPVGKLAIAELPLERGFVAPDLAVVTERDLFGERLIRKAGRARTGENLIAEASVLAAGDPLVHAEHGIGRFEGLETITVANAAHDCLLLTYAGGDRLYVPVENIDALTRFGSGGGAVELDRLGAGGWQSRKSRVKKRLMDMAEELVRVAALRDLHRTAPIAPESALYDSFCARFPYPETDDQLRAIEEIISDLGAGRPMERLVCGDVGFGKTEVALRAAFMVALSGKQVAVVVPTTLLARQHVRTFAERFAGWPLRLGALSRLVTASEAARVKRELEDGSIDIVVGTHALLGKSMAFNDLGLVIVDEEQHFGVRQKERLKQLRHRVHVLTLTATPIPRTLQLAMSGVRKMSLIATPPVDRLAVRTYATPYDPVVVREALMREHFRGGQSFYVVPRIEDIKKIEDRLFRLTPELKIAVAHGRMPPAEIEDKMTAFYEGTVDVLVATNIIESGLDIPSANTLIVHRADLFGLSQLYQLRGRIGRSKQRAFAYFTWSAGKMLSKQATERLKVIEALDGLGAGFTLASHDMDIRGAGNLLGQEQSGHIREVGIELFQQMLREAVEAAREQGEGHGTPPEERWTPQIQLGLPVLIPDSYVSDLGVRLSLYRRLGEIEDRDATEGFAAEMIDRFGSLPEEVDNLLAVVALKGGCRRAHISRIEAGPKGAVVSFKDDIFPKVERLLDYVNRRAGAVRLRPDQKLVFVGAWQDAARRLEGVVRLIDDLASCSVDKT
ncbi:MAG: transcription-repair coupling factor [Pseudomonadota bacterium]|nr:transcription-repair coupling factor [Pseudomonadota bacterium]